MTRWLLAACLVLSLAVGAWAQTTPQVKWEHDGANVTTFKCLVDDGLPAEVTYDLGLLTPESGQTYSINVTLCGPAGGGVMATGVHTLIIQACNASGCTSAAAITVVKL